MAPPNTQKRVKGVQIFRPFIMGTTARPFDPIKNPKPSNVPEDHTHSWTVFVKGVDDSDITYWCKKVQFKLHESIPNHSRLIENVRPGDPFEVHETGWGEFDINIKIFYEPISQEKAQTTAVYLKLHPFGDTEVAIENMRNEGEIRAWSYEEMVFNEPYEQFYEILTNPVPRGQQGVKGGKGGKMGGQTRTMGGGMVGSVGERTALIPLTSRPGQPFSRETEKAELRRLAESQKKAWEMNSELKKELREKEETLAQLRKELEKY